MGKNRRLERHTTEFVPSQIDGEEYYSDKLNENNGFNKKIEKKTPKKNILSKKKRKKLEKIVERKKKKIERTEIIASLQKVQIKPEELKFLCKTSKFSTKESSKMMIERHLKEVKVGLSTDLTDLAPNLENSIDKLETYQISCYCIEKLNGSKEEYKCNSFPVPKFTTFFEYATFYKNPNLSENVLESNFLNNSILTLKIISTKEQVEKLVEKVNEEIDSSVKIKKPSEKLEQIQREDIANMDVEPIPSFPMIKPIFLTINRNEEIENVRKNLPIIGEEFQIISTIKENLVTVICGETGSGKTTQLPQFLYESGFSSDESIFSGMIGITEPRRVAAISTSLRVGIELNQPNFVGYHIRYENNLKADTKIKFMTDGVLLKEIEKDFILSKYSCIIVDEAHERTLNTDILIGLLSRIVVLRNDMAEKKEDNVKPFRLIIMSATLRIEDFLNNSRLFHKQPPIIKIESRQYPVTIHFNRKTNEDYLQEAFNKVCKLHNRLPPGDVLVFLPSQRDIVTLVKMLRNRFSLQSNDEANQPLYVLPLYSLLPQEKQMKIFNKSPNGIRICIVSTNIAETSITVPNIRYIIDTGKAKLKYYDNELSGTSHLETQWISKASADQRAGRAGRTGPGHCYRLYSSAVFENYFKKYSVPEILRLPIDGVVLQMKKMNIDNVINFPFPTIPNLETIDSAENMLIRLGALSRETKTITPLGKEMAKFPVSPRLARLLVFSINHPEIIQYAIIISASLTVKNIFLSDIDKVDNDTLSNNHISKKIKETWYTNQTSDLLVLLNVVGAYEYSENKNSFCKENYIREKSMIEISKIRFQLTNIINKVTSLQILVDKKLKPPSKNSEMLLWQAFLAAYGDQIARRVKINRDDKTSLKENYSAYNGLFSDQPLYIHSSSVLFHSLPQWVIYTELISISTKVMMKGVTKILPSWISQLAPSLCTFSKVKEYPQPRYVQDKDMIYATVTATIGYHSWELSSVEIPYPEPSSIEIYKIFAIALLSGCCLFSFFFVIIKKGEVLIELSELVSSLIQSPTVLLKKWSNERGIALISSLFDNKISSKKTLLEMIQKNNHFLLEPLSLWLNSTAHNRLIEIWSHLLLTLNQT